MHGLMWRMAKPVEIPFSKIRNNPVFKRLNALERGLFFGVAQACLFDGEDLDTTNPMRLALTAGASGQQWGSGKREALKALRELLPLLKSCYDEVVNKKIIKARATSIRLKPYREKYNNLKRRKPKREPLIDPSQVPVILQP